MPALEVHVLPLDHQGFDAPRTTVLQESDVIHELPSVLACRQCRFAEAVNFLGCEKLLRLLVLTLPSQPFKGQARLDVPVAKRGLANVPDRDEIQFHATTSITLASEIG